MSARFEHMSQSHHAPLSKNGFKLIPRYETLLCDTEECRHIHHNIRYKVFCEQTGFEDAKAFPDENEIDEYDEAAEKFVMWDRLQRRWMAAMRLVHAEQTVLPSEQICRCPLKGLNTVRSRSVEFSRLAILRPIGCADNNGDLHLSLLSRSGPAESVPVSFSDEKNEPLLRLIWATIQWGMDHNVDYCYGIITSPLSRMFKSLGVPLEGVGIEVRHRGVRRPYRYNVHEARAGIAVARPKFAILAQSSRTYLPFSEFRSHDRRTLSTQKARVSARIPERCLTGN